MSRKGRQAVQVRLVGALTVCVCVLGTVGFVLSQRSGSPHEDAGTCGDCHLHDPDTAASETDKTLLVMDVDALCKRCHDVNARLSHPWNVPATKQPPEELPLDWVGRVTCTTCHYLHRKNRPDVTGYLIRTENIGRAFCQQCHDDLYDKSKGKHSAVLDRSHLGGTGSDTGGRALLDKTSLQCLGCHDGTVARASTFGLTESMGAWEHAQIGLSHPIGVDYPPKTHRRSQYRPVASLDPRILLFDGKLGCCSCHEPYSDAKHGLAMSNERSALCLECHMK